MTTLFLGTTVADITPDWPLTLAGFAARTEPSRGVSQPLRVTVSVLESTSDTSGPIRAVVIVADLLWWGQQDADSLRGEIANLAGTAPDLVLLSATHTHSGPQTSTRASHEIGMVDHRFTRLLRERVLQATREATNRLEPVALTRFTGRCDIAFNRRYERNPAGPIDPTLTVLRFDRPDGAVAALWVHFTCHPVITQEPLVSAEYCGVAMALLEARLGVPASFLQGCCGDINPAAPNGTTSLRGTHLDVLATGERLATAVNRLLATSSGITLAARPIRARTTTIDLPFADLPTDEVLQQRASRQDVTGEQARALLDHPEWRATTLPLTLQRLDLATGCSLVALNGEISVDYGLRIRQWSDGTALPLGYANGMTGYVPTARIIAEGGYEAGDAAPWFLLPGPFNPAVEVVMNRAISSILAPDKRTGQASPEPAETTTNQ